MKLFKLVWTRVNALSIDIVIGAVASMRFAELWSDDELPVWLYALLAGGVWVFYTADHLVDAWGGTSKNASWRHKLHHRYFWQLLALVVMLSVVGSWIVWSVFPLRAIVYVAIVGFITLVYFALVHRCRKRGRFLPKELLVAAIYTAGTWGVAFVWTMHQQLSAWFAMSVFSLFVLQEGLSAAWYDWDVDVQEGHPSLARAFGYKLSLRIMRWLPVAFLFVIGAMCWWWPEHWPQLLIMLVVNGVLASIAWFNSFFAAEERYRLVGELIFWLFGLVALWA